MNQRDYWNQAAQSDNLRDEWICDKNVSDEQCLDVILPYLKGRSLDLGCGIGRLTQDCGVDISQEMIAKAKPGKRYKVNDGCTLPYEDGFFDSVYSVFMFQHIPTKNKLSYIKEVYRVLKKKGIFRLQFVTYGDKSPFSHPLTQEFMIDILECVGFKVKDAQVLIMKEWTWITAVK